MSENNLRLLRFDNAALLPSGSLPHATRIIESFVPPDKQSMQLQADTLDFCRTHPDALNRTCIPGHITASAFLLDPSHNRFLLHHHRKLQLWLQFGGHCESGNLPGESLREAQEESGIKELAIHPSPMDLDIHRVSPPGKTPHLHYDCAFLVIAPPDAEAKRSEESLDLGWFSCNKLETAPPTAITPIMTTSGKTQEIVLEKRLHRLAVISKRLAALL